MIIFKHKEDNLQVAVCNYLRLQYPNVIFNSDLSGSCKLSLTQASLNKQIKSDRGFPDLAIYEKSNNFAGCFIELKKEGTKLYKKNGDYATEHIKQQAYMHKLLRGKGYFAEFAIGFDEAKKIIDKYLAF